MESWLNSHHVLTFIPSPPTLVQPEPQQPQHEDLEPGPDQTVDEGEADVLQMDVPQVQEPDLDNDEHVEGHFGEEPASTEDTVEHDLNELEELGVVLDSEHELDSEPELNSEHEQELQQQDDASVQPNSATTAPQSSSKKRTRRKRPPQPPSRQSSRNVNPNKNFLDDKTWIVKDKHLKANITSLEPTSYKEALSSTHADEWHKAMLSEYKALMQNHTWDLVPLPAGRKAIGARWVFKTKLLADGSIDRRKARFVAKGFTQRSGIDYEETFAPVFRFEDLRTLIAFAVHGDLELHQMDVDSAFLNGVLEEEVYVQQPEGFVSKRHPDFVCKLNKSLYGLKQSPRVWNRTIDNYLKSKGFSCISADPCIYIFNDTRGIAIIALYVDDNLLICNTKLLPWVKKILTSRSKMKDLGEAKSVLGIEVTRDRKGGEGYFKANRLH